MNPPRAPHTPLTCRWRQDQRGSVALGFVLASLGLMGATGVALDYTSASRTRTQLQNAADTAALAAAKEFRLGNATTGMVEQVARTVAQTTLGAGAAQANGVAATVTAAADHVTKTVTVNISAQQKTYVMQLFGPDFVDLKVQAKAKVMGGAPMCLVGLDTQASQTILMDKSARIQAPNCAVYSNSTKNSGLTAKSQAVLNAAFICTAGGKAGAGPGSFNPSPQTDCPTLPDPLASRPQPATGSCTSTKLVIDGGMTTLLPGTYCGGIKMTNGAVVTLVAGNYIIKDGPLTLENDASLVGINVSIFLSGNGAEIDFKEKSTVALTAPVLGDQAGMLFFEDRASPLGQQHKIFSDNAHTLLGTIYLSRGNFHIAANHPVAQQSAYTIVVARTFTMSEGPTMVLNTNYSSTNIPVPLGVGPNANRTALTN